jgi:hypothetical protein
VARGDVGVGVNLSAAAQERGIQMDIPHLTTLTDYMGVAGWVESEREGAWRSSAATST